MTRSKSVKTVARRKNMNECGGRSLGKPLCNAALNKALRMPGGGGGVGWKCQLRKEPRVNAESGRRRNRTRGGERGSPETPPRRRRRPSPLASPPLSSGNSSASPTLGRPAADPRPQPTPLCCGSVLPTRKENYPGGWE